MILFVQKASYLANVCHIAQKKKKARKRLAYGQIPLRDCKTLYRRRSETSRHLFTLSLSVSAFTLFPSICNDPRDAVGREAGIKMTSHSPLGVINQMNGRQMHAFPASSETFITNIQHPPADNTSSGNAPWTDSGIDLL